MSSLATTYDIFYSYNKIAWRWVASGIGSGIADVKGINTLTCNAQGQIQENWCEFNSLAWAEDVASPKREFRDEGAPQALPKFGRPLEQYTCIMKLIAATLYQKLPQTKLVEAPCILHPQPCLLVS